MTALTLANLPSSIATVEQLTAWCGLTLATINPTLAVLEAQDRAEVCAQINLFQAADGTSRLVVRASLPMDPALTYDRTKKLWLWTKDLSNTSIPAGFLAN